MIIKHNAKQVKPVAWNPTRWEMGKKEPKQFLVINLGSI